MNYSMVNRLTLIGHLMNYLDYLIPTRCLHEIIWNSLSHISNTLVNEFIESHSLSQSPQISKADDLIFDHTIIFVDFISYLIYDILDILWLGIRKS